MIATHLQYDKGYTVYEALIVVNGEIPHPSAWRDLSYRTLICTDGAANFLIQTAITPDIIIGDMDSIAVDAQFATANLLQKQFPATQIEQIYDQYLTDFEKALDFVQHNAIQNILCVGALGKAADHMLYNLSLIARCQTKLNIMLLNVFDNEYQWIFLLKPEMCISTTPGTTISFYPFSAATLSTQGLRWDLNKRQLTQVGPGAIRNKVLKEQFSVQSEGIIFCFVISETPPILA